MELRELIKETVVSIVRGVDDSNRALSISEPKVNLIDKQIHFDVSVQNGPTGVHRVQFAVDVKAK